MTDQYTDAKPKLNWCQAKELAKHLYGLMLTDIRDLPSYYDQNFHVVDKEGTQYLLKIVNSEDSKNPTLIEVQTHAMSFLRQQGLPAQTAMPTTTGQLMSLEQIDCGFGRQTYCVRLLTFLSGTTIAKASASPHILYEVGKMAAIMDKELKKMMSPNLGILERHDLLWSLSNTPLLEPYLPLMDDDPLQDVMKSVIEQYKTCVQPKLSFFQKGIIHGDFSDQNILVQPVDTGDYKVSGILDFGLLSINYCIFEVAISIMYLMLENPSPVHVGGAVLAGWESVTPLNKYERDALYLLVLCRFCQSLLIGRYNASKHPENSDYLMTTSRRGTQLLTKLWELGKEEVERTWFQDASSFTQLFGAAGH
ncbi:hydroxylysine kinase-like [Polymixia lowei]